MTAEALAFAVVPALFTGCGALIGQAFPHGVRGPPDDDVPLREAGPSEIDFQVEFDRHHSAVLRSTVCAEPAPLHAVLSETSPRGYAYLGFCDGSSVSRNPSGRVSYNLTFLRVERSMRVRRFDLDGSSMRTYVPADAEVEVRAEGEGVRLVGKGFDLHVRPSPILTGLDVDEGCGELERGPEYVICRRGGSHRVRARVQVDGRWFLAESDPRMRATLRQAQQMLRAVQLMYRSGR